MPPILLKIIPPILLDYDDVSTDYKISPSSLRNRNNDPDAADDDDASPNDAVYPDSLIDSKLKRKLTPGQWLN